MARTTKAQRDADDDLLLTARDRFKLGNEADEPQAAREIADLAFYEGYDQWPTEIRAAREGQQPTNGQPSVPSRPTLVINKVKEPVRQVLNQERASDLGIELVPADDFGDLGVTPDDSEVTLREGLIRRIQRESQAADARTWAFARAVIAGRGFYLVNTRYLPGKTNDQEIYVERIYNQTAVVLDPAHVQPDGSDAGWGFIGVWLSRDRYIAEYPKAANGQKVVVPSSENDFIALKERYPDWYRTSFDTKTKEGKPSTIKEQAVRVVNYWYTDYISRELVETLDGEVFYRDELPEDVELDEEKTRAILEKAIKYCKIGGGTAILDQTDWPGKNVPIVKVLGEELQPYDNQRRVIGMVRPARDAQMAYNYMVSKWVEQIGLSPIPPLMIDPEAVDGYEQFYEVMNNRTLQWLPHRTYDDQGRKLNEAGRPPVSSDNIGLAQSISLFDAAIKSTTAVPDSTLGNVDPSLKSGKAIQAVVANAAQSTSNFLDNLARSLRFEGELINDLLYPIYGMKPGRIVRILTGEGDGKQMQIQAPPEAPTAPQGDPGLPPGAPPLPPPGPLQTGPQGLPPQGKPQPKPATLTKDANFNVIIKVAKSAESRRAQEASVLADLMSANPELMGVYGDLFFKNSDIPGRMALADRAKVMLVPPVQQLLASEEQAQQPIPPAAQAQIQQLSQQVQQAQAIINDLAPKAQGHILDAQTKRDVEDRKQQGDTERAGIDAHMQIQMLAMKNATALAVAKINALTKGVTVQMEGDDEAIALDQQHAHEAAQSDLDRQHEQSQAMQAMAHAAATQGVQGQQDQQSSAQDHDQAMTQQQDAQGAAMASQQSAQDAAAEQAQQKPEPGA